VSNYDEFKVKYVSNPSGILIKDDRTWQICYSVELGKFVSGFGKIGGKIQFSARAVIPKVKRTMEEQCLLETNSKYTKVISTRGLKRVDDLLGEDTDEDGCGNDRPFAMGAHPAEKVKLYKDSLKSEDAAKKFFPASAQSKIDGVRCMADNMGKRLTSRGRKSFDHLLVDLGKDLETLFGILKITTDDVFLDGELVWIDETGKRADFQKTTSVVRQIKNRESVNTENLYYMIFSIVFLSDKDRPFLERYNLLEKAFKTFKSEKNIVLVERIDVYSHKDIDVVHKNFVKSGFEGTMIYMNNGGYEDKRSNNILKIKDFLDEEGTIIGVESGKGGREVGAAILVVETPKKKIIRVRPDGPIAQRKTWMEDPSLVMGKLLTYTFQEYSKDGVPRFPVGRAIRDYE